ncbi:MAG TPA: DNA double-strand break repair nuclease NurA, partial [Chroococcales cyanobacterium]
NKMAEQLDLFKEHRIPLVGYLSHSRGADIINCLRVSVCPYESSRCRTLCGHLNEEDFPCSKVWPLTDRQLLAAFLSRHQRSAVFQSGASVLKSLPLDQRICFSYLHVGDEIARLEFPRWLMADQTLLDLAMQAALNQCKKGMGYPIALSEAHHLAVIRGADRDRFFELMARHMVALGAPRVRQSPKESRKRTSFI